MAVYRDYRTPYGLLHYPAICPADGLPNLETYDQDGGRGVIVLQRAAMRGLWAAQVIYARRSGWSAERIERTPKGRPIRVLPGSYRTCATQAKLHASDPQRFADPAVSGHPRGICIDVDQSQPNLTKVNLALRTVGWRQVRPTDEPWHYSAPGGPVV